MVGGNEKESFMNIKKQIGKITQVRFGFGGYQDAQIGLYLQFGSDKHSWGVSKFYGAWANEPDKRTKWTKADQLKSLGETVMFLAKTLSKAKKNSVDELIDTPVECIFENNVLKD